MAEPRVTVLMTVYNGMPYLAEAVESVLRQTFQDLELVVIDDGSTDESPTYLAAVRDTRLRSWRHERREGQTRSLNAGLRVARGAYVARLDADDIACPDRIARQAAFLDQQPDVAVVGSWMRAMNAAGRHTDLLRRPVTSFGMLLGWLLLGVCPLLHPSVMFRRQTILREGGYDESFHIAQDYDLWARLALRRSPMAVLPHCLGFYRVHEAQQSMASVRAHREEIRQIHVRWLGSLGAGSEAEAISRLLRMDEGLWDIASTKARLVSTVTALLDLLAALPGRFRLSSQETQDLRRLVFRWLGPGVQRTPVFKQAPDRMFYPLFFLGSPLLIPRVRRGLSRLAGHWRKTRNGLLHGARDGTLYRLDA